MKYVWQCHRQCLAFGIASIIDISRLNNDIYNMFPVVQYAYRNTYGTNAYGRKGISCDASNKKCGQSYWL